jgi:hypothetical protein
VTGRCSREAEKVFDAPEKKMQELVPPVSDFIAPVAAAPMDTAPHTAAKDKHDTSMPFRNSSDVGISPCTPQSSDTPGMRCSD